MGNLFEKWPASYFVLFCLSFHPLVSHEWSGALQAKLHGKLVKKHFRAPRVVQSPPFGWFLELDAAGKSCTAQLFQELSQEEQTFFSDIDLKTVRLGLNQLDTLEWCRDHCGEKVTIEGELREPSFHRELACFYFCPENVDPPITEKETNQAYEKLNEISWEPSSIKWTEEDATDTSLELPDSEPERLISLTGTLRLRVLNGDINEGDIERGGYPSYNWIVKLDPESFKIACSTPVRAAFHSPGTIRSSRNCEEMALTGDYDEEWLCSHVHQTVTVQGYLWHAHTGHHHTPVMMDSEPWFKNWSLSQCKAALH